MLISFIRGSTPSPPQRYDTFGFRVPELVGDREGVRGVALRSWRESRPKTEARSADGRVPAGNAASSEAKYWRPHRGRKNLSKRGSGADGAKWWRPHEDAITFTFSTGRPSAWRSAAGPFTAENGESTGPCLRPKARRDSSSE